MWKQLVGRAVHMYSERCGLLGVQGVAYKTVAAAEQQLCWRIGGYVARARVWNGVWRGKE